MTDNVLQFRPRTTETPEPRAIDPIVVAMFLGLMLGAAAIAQRQTVQAVLPDLPPRYEPKEGE